MRARWTAAVAVGALLLVACGCDLLFGNDAPLARVSTPHLEGYAPLAVRLDAGESTDADGEIVVYRWRFGDGAESQGVRTFHTFVEPGQYTVRLEVVDDRGAIGTASISVDVREVPPGHLLRRFAWEIDGREQAWDLLIPESLYDDYRSRPPTTYADRYRYDAYVLDPVDDPTLEDFARALANRVGGDEEAFLEGTLAFVQGAIRYVPDPPLLERPRYPLETLVDGEGDCEDAAILFVSLVNARGAGASMVFVDTNGDRTPDHVAALVPVPDDYSARVLCTGGRRETLLVYDGALVAFAEAAADIPVTGYIPLGCDPWNLTEEDVIERWTFDAQ